MKPLLGKHILVTRGKSQAKTLTDRIERVGGVAIETPLLTFQLNDSDENNQILNQLHDYSWVFLTSSNGVKFFFELLQKLNINVPEHLKFAIIGKKTDRMLQRFGYEADFIPSAYNASTLGREFFTSMSDPGKVLYIRGNRSRDVLPRFFDKKHVLFQSITVYDTLLVKEDQDRVHGLLERRALNALTFTSPSTIQAYMSLVQEAGYKGLDLPCFCIGPTTAESAKEFGFKHVIIPKQYTIDDMIEEMIQYFS